jgi:cell division protein FtsN
MAENRKEKDKRVFFTRGQLVLLGAAFTVTAGIVFFLGVMVGKSIEARKMVKADEPLVKIPVKPARQGSTESPTAQPKEEITFYDTLGKTPAAEPIAEESPKETKPEKPKAEAKAAKLRRKEESPPLPAKSTEKQIEKPSASVEAQKASVTSEAAESNANGANWTVQVNAYPDERSAKLLVDQLKNKGYNAHVTEVLNKGKTWYRVRVGRYDSKEEAKKLEETLRTNENFAKAFATGR